MRYDFESAVISIINSVLLNAPIVTTIIIISVIIIWVMDKLNLIKQPRKKRKEK